jgi:O-antigen biosynthesis protein
VKVAFLVNDLQLSGGVSVIIEHARRLSAIDGWDVSLVLVREQEASHWHGYEHLPHLHVVSREQAVADRYDIAIATWWETAFSLFEIAAERYAYFVQSIEDRFYEDYYDPARLGAGLTLDLPVAFITEAQWIADTLATLRPDAPCYLVRNGIDKEIFSVPERISPQLGEPLRILVEGSPHSWFKHLRTTIDVVAAMREPHRAVVVTGDPSAVGKVPADDVIGPLSHREMADVYGCTDVVVKLSSVEGMFGPPLEGFHRGATCVVTPVTGHEEYVEHGFNGLLADWEDIRGTARQLDLLARDRELLHYLRCNALETARAWPSWDQASDFMAAALLAIRRQPQTTSAVGTARLLADLRSGLEVYEQALDRGRYGALALGIERALRRVRRNRIVSRLLGLRRYRVVQLVARPVRPLVRRLRQLSA